LRSWHGSGGCRKYGEGKRRDAREEEERGGTLKEAAQRSQKRGVWAKIVLLGWCRRGGS